MRVLGSGFGVQGFRFRIFGEFWVVGLTLEM